MENKDKDIVWALEQASKFAKKFTDAKEDASRLENKLKALTEALENAKKEIGYLSKLSLTQQQYIEKLEELLGAEVRNKTKETTILTIHRKSASEDAC